MSQKELYTLGIDIGSTTVKIALVDENNDIAFSDYERHFANIQETLSDLFGRAIFKFRRSPRFSGHYRLRQTDTGQTPGRSIRPGGTAVATPRLRAENRRGHRAPGGEDAKIVSASAGGNAEQRMNGVCAGGTGSFIDQMASLLQTDAAGLSEYAKNYQGDLSDCGPVRRICQITISSL
ncbi:MAG: hypothetical protein ACLTLQ_13790 [[Clostridium] scindens]